MIKNFVKKITFTFLVPCLISGLFFYCKGKKIEEAGVLHAGVAVIDITPPIGYPVHKIPSEGVLDPLEVKTIVFSQNDCRAALIIADLFYTPLSLSDMVRKLSSEKTGIPVSNICVAATHTHADPTCYDEIEEYVQKINSGEFTSRDEESYAGELISKLVNSVVEAQADLKPVNLKSGMINIGGVSFNRRHLMKDGTVKMNGGFLNPEIIRAVGPVDPELGVILLSDEKEDRTFASFSTFAMQLATIGSTTKFSSGFPYFMEKKLQSYFGEDHVSIFGEGPCADVNHWDISKPGPQTGYHKTTRATGEKIAGRFIERSSELKTMKPDLGVRNSIIEVPLQTYSEMDLKWAKNFDDPTASSVLKARVRKILTLEKLRQKYDKTMPLEVQAFRINNETAIIALPGQIFVELGLAIKEASPFKTTLIITLANSHEDCIPLRKAFPEGSYEIVYSLVESGGGEMLTDTAIALLNELKK